MGERTLTARRLAGPAVSAALVLAVVAAVAETAATVLTGRLAQDATSALLVALAAALLGATVLDTVGRTVFSGAVGRAEGVLRGDLLQAALAQPLPALADQAVGEVLDRVDDDPRQLAQLLRTTGWDLARSLARSCLAWVVAGLTWWPAWIAFPLVTALALLVARPLTRVLAARKVVEETAWTDHAAQLEEVVAGRDDVRASLGQAHVVRRYADQARAVLDAVRATSSASAAVGLRTTLVLSGLLAALAVGGVVLVSGGGLGVGELVTLWLLVGGFVGDVTQVSNRLPEVQAGLGALTRIRGLLGAPAEDAGGAAVPTGALDVELRDLSFAYPDGGFALQHVSLAVAAGTTLAVLGRSGAGKSTLASLLSRAVEPPRGAVLLGGQDVRDTAIADLRRAVGVVTQRTELLAATLAENITLFTGVPRAAVVAAVEELGLAGWVATLPDGLDTRLGPGGLTLSAGEEQLVAFARLLVRDVGVVVLDEATARMDPVTEHRVTTAAERLLVGRTGLLIAHRLSTTRRAHTVAVLERGRLVQHGPRGELASAPGPFRDLLTAAGEEAGAGGDVSTAPDPTPRPRRDPGPPPPRRRPRLARTVLQTVAVAPSWGVVGALLFLAVSVLGAYGTLTGWLWGLLVQDLRAGEGLSEVAWTTAGLCASLLLLPPALAGAFRVYPLWWNLVTLQLRLAVLRGQTRQRRLLRTPPGEVTARCLDSERLVLYADRWVDVVIGAVVVVVTGVTSGSVAAAGVVAAVMALSAAVSVAGAPVAGASGRTAGDARVAFGRSLASSLDAARTVKLAAAGPAVLQHLADVDRHRVAASVREFRVRALLDGVPGLLVQTATVATWVAYLAGVWDIATTLLVATTLAGATWFGTVAGAAVTEAPVAREWVRAMTELAGGDELVALPPGVDLRRGLAPRPAVPGRRPLRQLRLDGLAAVHDDGTVGVQGVDLTVHAGELVLLAGRVGSGKSSLLGALAGLLDHEGSLRWNDDEVADPQTFLRPGQVCFVAQVPRVLSGSFSDNVRLDHEHPQERLTAAFDDARLRADLLDAGGSAALVGHRGVRLSGGQVQRLALARALATGADLLVADDVSSALDARTEVELWEALRRRGVTVVGSSSKRSALLRADRVVVLDDGRVAASGPWRELQEAWGHLAG
ncbi:ATP-binding cassette domain-containing protein [Kineococcus rubinsiae]|uniref:ATP-binding cassette domain-containing protein n=1 Tax=Kineococcus rubinsiae TaxID=2609562 RepID=UPI00142F5619|nr:ABC transporter ATP-binding protein [Kineococcus rubinsiae]NIZ91633.1 ABC transporter ATP-binding protein [Kineococcus rubinsiae]